MATSPADILVLAYEQASDSLEKPLIDDKNILKNIELIARNTQNRAGVRLIMACALAKLHNPSVDIRKPYTEIGDPDVFSGRRYDEGYLTDFITAHELPCNSTTAFLTPALRNISMTLTMETELIGRPRHIYQAALFLLNDVYKKRLNAQDLLTEMVRLLLTIRNEQQQRMNSLLHGLKLSEGETLLSAEGIITLIEQHLRFKYTSRLPVLIVAAAYHAVEDRLGERALSLHSHNAADKQTGSLGDVEITLIDDEATITCYEMKTKPIIKSDIDQALAKILQRTPAIANYIFITTELIDQEVQTYAANIL